MPRRKQVASLPLLRWLWLLPVPLVWCVLSHYGALVFLENKAIDWRFQYRGELSSPVKIVYVNVDSLSLSGIGGMPWSRGIYAEVADVLIKRAGIKGIAFDIVFSDAGLAESVDRSKLVHGNAALGRLLLQRPPVVLAAAYGGRQFLDVNGRVTARSLPVIATEKRPLEELEPPELPSFETSADPGKRRPFTPPVAAGLIDTLDGGTRWVPAWAPGNRGINYYHMAVELARLYWELPADGVRVNADRLEFVTPEGIVRSTAPLRDGQMIEVNWFTRWASPHMIHAEFAEVYEYAGMLQSDVAAERAAAEEYFAQDEFKDAIVLVGPVDPLLQDLAPTSLDAHPVPKVSVHGNLLKTIVAGAYLQRLPEPVNHALIIALTAVVTGLAVTGGARTLIWKLLALASVAFYGWLTLQWFSATHLVLPLVAPVGAALTTSFTGLVWQVIDEQKAKGRIKGMFGAYVSPQLVERMVESGEDPQLGGHDAEITAYFSDIQGFSSFSEKLGSGPLVELMNEYLTACTDIVQAQGGTLDKYIGDAIVAMFGAPIPLPDHAYRACVATQLIHQKLAELRARWRSEGERWPDIVWKMQSRIGLNTGVCMIGNMGSRTRFNYTMMGDNVNLAARMESGAKRWGVYTMVTEATRAACVQHGGDRVVFRPLGRIVVMGRTQAVPIHEVVGLKESLPPEAVECIRRFSAGLARYYARDWEGALELFRASAALEPNQPGRTAGVKTNPSLEYIELVEALKAAPPAETWDGAYVMTEK